jgi:nucleoside-diphosphate-sugar epimerase
MRWAINSAWTSGGATALFSIDEEHPLYTTDPNSFSKQMIEEFGGYFWRRAGVSSVFLRFPAVYDLEGRPAFDF